MRTFAQKPKATQQNMSAKSTIPGRAYFGHSREVDSILHLQRTIGNQAVQRLLERNTGDVKGDSVTTEIIHFGHDFSQIQAYPKPPVRVQAKLTINTPGDVYEEEADRIAGQMMHVPEPQLQRACRYSGGCLECQVEQLSQGHQFPQTRRVQANDAAGTVAPPIVDEVLRSPGQSLDETTRWSMESRFSHDFSRVRVHADAKAAESAQTVNARAYTNGLHIVFGTGEYAPGTTEGRRVLAHELVHVVQQERGPNIVQRYPKGPGVLTSSMERRVDKALARMQDSSLDYEVTAANDILSGSIDIAFPDFIDTSKSPPVPMAATSALIRKQRWEHPGKSNSDNEELDIKALIPGTKREIPIRKRAKAITLHHGVYDGVIYLLSSLPSGALATVLLHETLHLLHPLAIAPGQPGADREHFVSELRSYYYATYRKVNDPELRFERAVRDAEKDTGYLAGLGMSIDQVLLNRATWLAEVGAP